MTAATKVEAGNPALLNLRHQPGMVSLVTAALACGSSRNWANLKVLAVDPAVHDKYDTRLLTVLEATDPYDPFPDMGDDIVVNTLARATTTGREVVDCMKDFTERRNGKYHTPVAEWLHHVLRQIFSDQWPDDDAYDSEFDRAEAVLGVWAQDATNVRLAATAEGRGRRRSRWYGRSTWRSANGHGNPVADLVHEFETQGSQWGPLEGGLFGRDEERARAALENYQANFDTLVSHRSFM